MKIVDDQFWHAKWAKNQIGFHQEKINSRLKNFWPKLAIPAGDQVFVPLCGKSLDMCWLAERHAVLGIELSDIAVQGFFNGQGITPDIVQQTTFTRYSSERTVLLCGDFFALTARDLEGVAGIFDRASLVALPTPLRIRYAQHLADIVKSGCKMLLITMVYDEHKMNGPPFSIPESEVNTLFVGHFDVVKLAESNGPDIVGNLSERGLDTLTEQVFMLTRK